MTSEQGRRDVGRIVVHVDAEIAEMVPGFLDNRHADVQTIRAALDAGDLPSIRRLGHNMKGAGAAYGFDWITENGAALERAALATDAAAIRGYTDALADYLERVEVEPEPAE
jgi:HPt (histidine-containing phosphotransfer) domain-containing protein